MGYYTEYKLEIEGNEPHVKEVAKFQAKRSEYSDEKRFWRDVFEGNYESIKWYQSSSDMREISKNWPGTLFVLHGDGEDDDDKWAEFWLGGKSYTERMPQWTPAPFDSSKLRW